MLLRMMKKIWLHLQKLVFNHCLQNTEEMLFMSEFNSDEWDEEWGTEEQVNSIDH